MSNRFKRTGYKKKIDGDVWKLRKITAGERAVIVKSEEHVNENPLDVLNEVICKMIVEIPSKIVAEYKEVTGEELINMGTFLDELPVDIYDSLAEEVSINVGLGKEIEKK